MVLNLNPLTLNAIHQMEQVYTHEKMACHEVRLYLATQHNSELQTYPVSMRSGTPYGPFLVCNTAVPDVSGRRGGCSKL